MQHEEQELTVGPDGENQWETVFRIKYSQYQFSGLGC